VVKHRTLAAHLIEEGNVRLNRAKVIKPAQAVKPADVLTITIQDTVRVLRVKDTGSRRGPFAEACLLYEDLTSAPSQVEKDRA
jgi:ribosome-associated heat shock protein Hsp15